MIGVEFIYTFDKLRQISGILGLHSNTHDRRHGELHDLQVVRVLEGGDGSSLHEILVDSNEASDVSRGNVLDGLDVTSHHENGTLDSLLIEILLLANDVVRSLDASLHSRGDL